MYKHQQQPVSKCWTYLLTL